MKHNYKHILLVLLLCAIGVQLNAHSFSAVNSDGVTLYYSYGTGENERIIDPAEMFLFQDGWYCAAFCEKKQDIRHFELKRIIKYELLDEKYE